MSGSKFSLVLFVVTGVSVTTLFGQRGRNSQKMEGSVHRSSQTAEERSTTGPLRGVAGMARPARRLSLRALSAAEANPVSRKAGLRPVGVNRTLPDNTLALGEWTRTVEGKRVWRVELQSTGAEAVRVRFADFRVGGGRVWLLATDGVTAGVGPYSGNGLFGDNEFWSDMVAGDSIVVAYEPAEDAGLIDEIPFKIKELSHRVRAAAANSEMAAKATPDAVEVAPRAAAASCAVDVACYSEYREPASAVALMIFESEGATYECSGSLVSSASSPALPFFLTANHCISKPEEARSLIAFFNYQTPSCNGTAPSLGSLPRVNGASFVAGQPMELGDFTLLRLASFPNIDVKVLGWSGADIQSNERVIGISHPRGDYKRISFGQRTRDVTIRFADGESMPADRGYQVSWLQGVTQGGSSGSPLLATIDGQQYVVGTLSAGPDVDEDNSTQVCRTRNLTGSYGRFSVALPYLQPYLTTTTGESGGAGSASGPVLSANPNPVFPIPGGSTGRTTITWNAPGVEKVQIRIGSPTGPAMTGIEGPSGSAQTGDWVADGTTFYLQDAGNGDSLGAGKTLGTLQVRVSSSSASASARTGVIGASPNPVIASPGRATGAITLNWQSEGVTRVQVRVGSPTGPALTGIEPPTGSATTGNWVPNGMTFYLQDASDGSSFGSTRTLASVRVQVVVR